MAADVVRHPAVFFFLDLEGGPYLLRVPATVLFFTKKNTMARRFVPIYGKTTSEIGKFTKKQKIFIKKSLHNSKKSCTFVP